MVKKLEERYIVKLKELKQSSKLVEENERSIEGLEEEIGTAKKCLNLVFRNDAEADLFTEDTKIFLGRCTELC